MPVEITGPLTLDPQEREIEVVVDPKDRLAGTVRVSVREIPHGKHKALLGRGLSALAVRKEGKALLDRLAAGGALSEEESEAMGQKLLAAHRADRDFVRWGVSGHRAEDFLNRGQSVPFVGEDAEYLGQRYRVASPLDLLLYTEINRPVGEPAGSLFGALGRAVGLFQGGVVETPEEVWARAEKGDEPAEE